MFKGFGPATELMQIYSLTEGFECEDCGFNFIEDPLYFYLDLEHGQIIDALFGKLSLELDSPIKGRVHMTYCENCNKHIHNYTIEELNGDYDMEAAYYLLRLLLPRKLDFARKQIQIRKETKFLRPGSKALTRDALTTAFKEVEKHDLPVTKIVMNAQAFADIRKWGQNEFDPVTQHEVLQTGNFGHLWTAEILISKKVPANTVYVMSDPEFVGVMPVRQDIQVIPADEPEKLRVGWVVYEEIGMSVLNAQAVAKIEIQ